MESINIAKGYEQVNSSDDTTSQLKNITAATAAHRRTIVAIGLLVCLTIFIGSWTLALITESNSEPQETTPSSSLQAISPESIRVVCSVTQYPESCFSSICSSIHTYNNSNVATRKPDPEFIFAVSIQVAFDEATNISSIPKALISKSTDPRTESALRDCASLFGDVLSQLNDSLSSAGLGPGSGGKVVLTEEKVGNLKTWISAAMSDQETCLDGLEEMGSTVLDEVRAKVQKSKEYMSNSLAILSNIQNLLDKFGLKMR